MSYSRRSLLAHLGLAGVGTILPPFVKQAAANLLANPAEKTADRCPFRLAVINDEITQDFEKACQIVSGDFG